MSPQKENGFTPIANELFEAFYRCKLTEYERVVMMCIWRKTYGWSKKTDWISLSQLELETGIPKTHASRTLTALRDKRIVIMSTKRQMSIRKDYREWKVEWRGLPHQVTGVTSPGNKRLPHQVTTKERKETKQKQLAKTSFADNKLTDMAFNSTADDYEEGVVNMDGDISLAKKKKPRTAKYPNAPTIRKIFQEVLGKNPATWKQHSTQLQACENLYTERGVTAIKNALEYFKENKADQFIVQITSPHDLDLKWSKLAAHKNKQS